jgi:CRP-like cAMP-binding protein
MVKFRYRDIVTASKVKSGKIKIGQMEPFESLIINVSKKIQLEPDQLQALRSRFKWVRVKKRQFMIQPGFVAQKRIYVVSGSFRSYVIDKNGRDVTTQFAIDDWWITDYNSFIYQTPATQFVVALEDSITLQISYSDEQDLKASSRQFEALFRMMAEKSAAFMARRIISNLTKNAEERYNEFVEKYPEVVQRLPLYVLATYLNMTREFLSKIRNEKVVPRIKTY